MGLQRYRLSLVALTIFSLAVVGLLTFSVGPASAKNATTASVGYHHACAVDDSGSLWCWGNNRGGQLGPGPRSGASRPVLVAAVTDPIHDLDLGYEDTCVVLGAGELWCWGGNKFGILGADQPKRQPDPVQIQGLPPIDSVSVGMFHACAITETGDLYCWGNNLNGQLGIGSLVPTGSPSKVSDIPGSVVDVSAGSYHTCAVNDGGAIFCWGSNRQGKLGIGSTEQQTVPTPVPALVEGVVSVVAGGTHTCAITESAALLCWGAGGKGQLGIGSQTLKMEPTLVTALTDVTQVALGYRHTCAVESGGAAFCWGDNLGWQVGAPNTDPVNEVHLPSQIRALSDDVVLVGTGAYHSCAVRSTGQIRCWGDGYGGRVGDGTQRTRDFAMGVAGFEGLLPGTARPDVMVAQRANDPYRGDDVYNMTAEGQKIVVSARPGGSRDFFVTVENDGSFADQVVAQSQGGGFNFDVRYFLNDINVTHRLASGLWKPLDAGGSFRLRVSVRIDRGAPDTASLTLSIIGQSVNDSILRDRTQIKVVVR